MRVYARASLRGRTYKKIFFQRAFAGQGTRFGEGRSMPFPYRERFAPRNSPFPDPKFASLYGTRFVRRAEESPSPVVAPFAAPRHDNEQLKTRLSRVPPSGEARIKLIRNYVAVTISRINTVAHLRENFERLDPVS